MGDTHSHDEKAHSTDEDLPHSPKRNPKSLRSKVQKLAYTTVEDLNLSHSKTKMDGQKQLPQRSISMPAGKDDKKVAEQRGRLLQASPDQMQQPVQRSVSVPDDNVLGLNDPKSAVGSCHAKQPGPATGKIGNKNEAQTSQGSGLKSGKVAEVGVKQQQQQQQLQQRSGQQQQSPVQQQQQHSAQQRLVEQQQQPIQQQKHPVQQQQHQIQQHQQQHQILQQQQLAIQQGNTLQTEEKQQTREHALTQAVEASSSTMQDEKQNDAPLSDHGATSTCNTKQEGGGLPSSGSKQSSLPKPAPVSPGGADRKLVQCGQVFHKRHEQKKLQVSPVVEAGNKGYPDDKQQEDATSNQAVGNNEDEEFVADMSAFTRPTHVPLQHLLMAQQCLETSAIERELFEAGLAPQTLAGERERSAETDYFEDNELPEAIGEDVMHVLEALSASMKEDDFDARMANPECSASIQQRSLEGVSLQQGRPRMVEMGNDAPPVQPAEHPLHDTDGLVVTTEPADTVKPLQIEEADDIPKDTMPGGMEDLEQVVMPSAWRNAG